MGVRNLDTDFLSLVNTLMEKTVHAPRVLVDCHSLETWYAHFHYELGDASYYPPGFPHLSDYIISVLWDPALLSTIRMSPSRANIRDVNTIIHVVLQSLEDYIYTFGRVAEEP